MAWSAFRKMPLWRCCDFQEWFDPDRWVCLHLDNTSWTELTSPPSKHLAGHLIHAMCAMWNRISQIWSFFHLLVALDDMDPSPNVKLIATKSWHSEAMEILLAECKMMCQRVLKPSNLRNTERISWEYYILWIKWYLDCAKLLCTHISSTLNSFVFAPFWAICSWDISNRLWSWPAHLMIGALYSPRTLHQDRVVKPF